MGLQLGDTAPDFSASTTHGPIHFHEWAGTSWVVLFSHPKDFTPVCTTELGYLARLRPQFDERNVKVIGLSVDTLESHTSWAQDIESTQGYAVNFPLIADSERVVARRYGMIHPAHDELFTVRTVFVIDPARKIRLTLSYPQTAGRNFEELLRVIDSLQLTDAHAVSTPVNWHAGEDVIIVPAVSDADARTRFPQGWRTLRPYLRLTPDPRTRDTADRELDLEASG
jgi:thioredoxin-dependent peroxiredoxin